MSDTTPDPLEAALTRVVDAEPVLLEPDLDDATLHRFIEDVAQMVHPVEVISRRYGFPHPKAMVTYIEKHREIRRRIKVRRAIWESDDNVEGRIRKLAAHSILEAMPQTANMMFDPQVPNATRLDALKVHSRMAGVDGLPAAGKDGHGGSGNQFTVNFMFSNGQVQKVSTTVVDAAPAEALPAPDDAA